MKQIFLFEYGIINVDTTRSELFLHLLMYRFLFEEFLYEFFLK